MELIDRWLRLVKDHLPRKDQEDILRELSANVHERLEDEEERLGRDLSEAEVEAILNRLGNPAAVAARYRPDAGSLVIGRRVIGPELFPLYSRVLAINLAFTLFLCLVAVAVFGGRVAPGQIATGTLRTLAFQLLIATLVFAAADRDLVRHPERWNRRAARTDGAPSRGGSLFELIVTIVATLWWMSLPATLGALVAGVSPALVPGPTATMFHTAVLVLSILQIAATLHAVLRPEARRVHHAARVLCAIAIAGIGFASALSGRWAIAVATGADAAKVATLVANLNAWCSGIAAATAMVVLVIALVQLRRRAGRVPAAIPHAAL